MLSLGFLNPLLLWALPLAAVPILIHLLNRRRFQRVPWAAMEFLLAAMKRNRKRLRMEQWLVLLLRTLAVLFLVFLVARPQLTGGGLVGVTTHHVVLLDDSASMTQRSGATNMFEKAQDAVRNLAERLGQTRGGDMFSLVRSGNPTAPELWGERIGPDLGRRVGTLLKELPAGDGVMDLGSMLQHTRKRAADVVDAGRTEYYLVSDFRERDWLTEESRPRAVVAREILAMKTEAEHLTVMPLGVRDSANLSVVDVRRMDRISVAGVPVTLAVDVFNWGLDNSAPTEIAVEVDGKSRVVRPVEPMAPGTRTTVPVTHTFRSPGFHRVEAYLPTTDRYVMDDRRTLAIEVQDRSRVLLVDGAPGRGPEDAETFFLAIALDPGGEAVSGIEAQVVSDLGLQEQELSEFDMVWLCNVPEPGESTVAKLEEFAAAGGGLVFFLGDQIEPRRYNEVFWKDGDGLLPLPLAELAGDPDRPEHGFLVARDHPLAARAPEALELLFARAVLFKRYITLEDRPTAEANVVLRVRDAEGAPLIATGSFGDGGRVVLIGTTADKEWSTWPDTYAYLIVCNEMHRFGAKVHDLSAHNFGTRGTLRLELDPGLFRPDVVVRAADGSGEERTYTALPPPADEAGADSGTGATGPGVAPDERPGTDGGQETEPTRLSLEIPMTDLRGLGAYEVLLQGHGDVVETRMFARNPPVEESDLRRMTQSAITRVYPPETAERVTFIEEGGGSSGTGTGEGEIWRLLAAALLAGLLLESLLAWRFGRR